MLRHVHIQVSFDIHTKNVKKHFIKGANAGTKLSAEMKTQ
jgi:hypothetical protein